MLQDIDENLQNTLPPTMTRRSGHLAIVIIAPPCCRSFSAHSCTDANSEGPLFGRRRIAKHMHLRLLETISNNVFCGTPIALTQCASGLVHRNA